MIGKRVIRMKRPAVLCAAAFVVGIVAARYSGWIAAGVTVGLVTAYILFLRNLHKGRRRVSAADRLLIVVPAFLLLGYFVMSREARIYETDASAFEACMEAGREVLAEGTVSEIHRTARGVRLELKDASCASYDTPETEYRPIGNLLVYAEDVFAENGEIKYGQHVFVYGKGSLFEEAPNPGGFDAKAYYFSLGITGAIQGKTIRITDFSYHRLNQALFQAKSKLLNSYATYLGEEGAGVISSMLLGERALLSDETQELYRHGGISHILAISGLHVSLIGMALYEMLRKTVLGRNGAIPVACAGVLLYGTFVEAGTSTKRAVIMFLLLLLATVLGRAYDTLSAMSVSVIVILFGSPGALYTASFQLSFAAAYGSSVVAVLLRERGLEEGDRGQKKADRQPRIGQTEADTLGVNTESAVGLAQKVVRKTGSKWWRLRDCFAEKIRSMFLFGLAIQVVTFPFTVYHFFEYPTYGFLLNPIVVPLMTILLLCGLLSGVCGLFVPWLGYFFAGGTGGILWTYEMLCRGVEKFPGALLLFGQPKVWQMGLYFAILVLCLYAWQTGGEKRGLTSHKWMNCLTDLLGNAKVVFSLLLFLPLCLLPVSGAAFEAAFLDVDQGDGIVLRERGGAVLLVDGGSTGVQKVGEKRIIPYLKSQGIRVIDCAFVSHTDSDHMSGLKEILEAMPVYSVYRESVPGYAGTPVIKSIVLPELYGTEGESKVEIVDETYLALVELAEEKNVKVYYMAVGDRMTVGKGLVLSCLAPEEGVVYADKNASSMVLLATYGEFDMLLTGDMDKAGEMRLLEKGVLMPDKVEVLKVSHHGSRTASSEAFITVLRPRISVISCGKENRYGHPHTETLETLYGVNGRVYRTDESGCVTVKVGKDIKAEKFKKEE